MTDLVEVRLLGGFSVRTEAGDLVGPATWRTSKTRDLVGMLALRAGQVVPVDLLVDALWPDVDPERGRASLRTAATQVRQVLGPEHLTRRSGGFVLEAVWVDALAFEALVIMAGHHLAAGDASAALSATWQAATLYAGDLCPEEPYADWVDADREHYRRLLRQLLLDAGEAAVKLGWVRDAVELGHRALQLDPCAERAYRTLMRAYVSLGEPEQALRLYEQCRGALVDAFGADPSAETQALHLQLLRPLAAPQAQGPFVGRSACLSRVTAALPVVVEAARPAAFLVSGPAGSGRTRFVQEVAGSWPHRVVCVDSRDGPEALDLAVSGISSTRSAPVLLVVEGVEATTPAGVRALVALLAADGLPLLLLATTTDPLDEVCRALLDGPHGDVLVLPAMPVEEVAELLRGALGTRPCPALAEELARTTAGNPAAVLETARGWLAAGQLVSTSDGMARVPWRPVGRSPGDDRRLARARDETGALGSRVVDLLSVLDRWTGADEVARLLGERAKDVRQVLDALCDLGVVTATTRGHRLRDAVVRRSAYYWLRPSVRRRLHLLVGEGAVLPPRERVAHWLWSGEPALACAAAVEAADAALLRGDDVEGRLQLVQVLAFVEQLPVEPAERIAVHERLAAVEHRLGRSLEARRLLEQALGTALSEAPEAVDRLRRQLVDLSGDSALLRDPSTGTWSTPATKDHASGGQPWRRRRSDDRTAG